LHQEHKQFIYLFLQNWYFCSPCKVRILL